MTKDGIAGLTIGNNLLVSSNNVGRCGFRVFAIVHQNDDIVILEAMTLLEVFNHLFCWKKQVVVSTYSVLVLSHKDGDLVLNRSDDDNNKLTFNTSL
jgi:hypothetical protein